MASSSHLYDLTLLLDSEAPSERRAEILGEVERAVGAGGGSIESRHDWGVRTLTYQIDHRSEAEYHLLQFTGSPDLLAGLDRSLKLADGIIRHRIIMVRPGTPPPPAMRPEARPPAETRSAETAAAEAGPPAETQSAEPAAAEAPAEPAAASPAEQPAPAT